MGRPPWYKEILYHVTIWEDSSYEVEGGRRKSVNIRNRWLKTLRARESELEGPVVERSLLDFIDYTRSLKRQKWVPLEVYKKWIKIFRRESLKDENLQVAVGFGL